MKRKLIILSAMLLTCVVCTQAQIEVEAEDEEIIVTDEYGDMEEIDFPEAMADNMMDSLMNLYESKSYLTVDDDCRTTGENPLYTKEEYIERLMRMPTVMEMSYNEVVRSCIDRYAGRLRRQVGFMLGASNFYMPIFEEALEAYQVPLELKYLPIIESALNPTAVSRVGATGLWQFMVSTGKMYNLEINSLIDERRDPVKASYAAAHLLSDLYKVYGDWNLVIAAYNCGPGNINKAIARAGGERDYWKIYPYLPKETRGYVPAFIAANYVMTYYCEHGICPMRTQLPSQTDTVMVNRDLTLSQIASVCNLDIQMLRALNPVYRRDIVPGASKPMPIRLPLNDVNTFIAMQDSVYASSAPLKRSEVEIDNTFVPSKTASSKRAGRRNARGGRRVTVRKGESLSTIARRNGTTVQKLKRLNGIRGTNIRAGQKLRVK
ncbi:transglycosylase SLT domain-containing protein [Prevotella sp. E13-17]|uniref:lytic transglycosylase domain-containing protein n=1 Tax=Prevotella sp. E13-17 TaxID=2913616 RepID=UPI001ED9EBA1|nr:lytic transglycosylase domain-containing protein [Prevotella sp. E13-17]UKK51765.1 transglycosylase SLT domain-containing protein [Prevotella sp. E13-17]